MGSTTRWTSNSTTGGSRPRCCDLKLGPFRDAYVGQMNKYVSFYRERVPRHAWEKPAIGLIICQGAGCDEVRYALAGLEEKIFVAEYQVQLPTAERITERLGELTGPAGGDDTGDEA